ncbi:hypothetical protein QMN69_24905, partial [Escherichia coli]|nr:hypothetical protein [Escherichia coli]
LKAISLAPPLLERTADFFGREKNWQASAPEGFFDLAVGKCGGVGGNGKQWPPTQGGGWEWLMRHAYHGHQVSCLFFKTPRP